MILLEINDTSICSCTGMTVIGFQPTFYVARYCEHECWMFVGRSDALMVAYKTPFPSKKLARFSGRLQLHRPRLTTHVPTTLLPVRGLVCAYDAAASSNDCVHLQCCRMFPFLCLSPLAKYELLSPAVIDAYYGKEFYLTALWLDFN